MMYLNIKSLIERRRALLAGLLLGAIALVGIGCDQTPSELEDYDPDPVLSAFIENGQPVDTIYVEWVGKFHDYYDVSELGITDAEVILFPVGTFSGDPLVNNDTLTFHYTGINGEYAPDDLSYIIQGLVRYRIEATSPEMSMWAETTVPDTFSYQVFQGDQPVTLDESDRFVGTRGDTLNWNDEELYFTWTAAQASSGCLLGLYALDDREDIVPLFPGYDLENEELQEELENVPLFGYTIAPDYQTEMTLSWIYYTWSGNTKIIIEAGSDDYYLFLFTSLSSSETYSNIHGGLGIFGATTKKAMYVTMERVEMDF